MRIATCFLTMTFLAVAASANAAITEFHFTEVAQSLVADHQTTDISLSGTGKLTGVQMFLALTDGAIYQNGDGGTTAPSQSFIGFVPALEFDTFVALGGTTSDVSLSPVIPGGAVNLGGASGETFDAAKLDITWAPPGATPAIDPANYFVSRLTLSNSATGTLLLMGSTPDGDFQPEAYNIVAGKIVTGGVVDPVAVGDPTPPGPISLQAAFDDGSGVLAQAIKLSDSADTGTLAISGYELTGPDAALFGFATNGSDPLAVDLTLDLAAAHGLPKGTILDAQLLVKTNGGNLSYNLTASVPEPSSIVLVGLSLVGLVGYARRS